MRRSVLMLGVLLVASQPGTGARAETVGQAYKSALADYYAGRYERAVAGLERVLAIPMNDPDVHYNLGCAYFRLNRPGRAIYHFERALMLDHDSDDAAFNLATVRDVVARRVKDELKGAVADPAWIRAVRSLSSGGWAVAFVVCWWLTFVVLFLLRFINQGPARSGLIAGNSFLALMALVLGMLLAGRVYLDARVKQGIVLPDSVAVKEGPGATTKTSFTLHAGLKVRVQASDGAWIRIRLPNGLEGWVPKQQLGLL